MTQEEKARAYDKALEQAKKELNTCGSMDCDAARQIFRFFPELRENEDERMRKEIISIVKAYRENCIDEGTHRFDDCLSWLEKQKEQKDYRKLYEDIAKSEWFKKAYEGKSLGCDDEQKEQKPVEWSEEDKEAIEMCLDAIPKKWKTKSGILLTEWFKSLCNSLPKQSDSFCKTNCKGFQETGRCFVDGPCVAKQSWS